MTSNLRLHDVNKGLKCANDWYKSPVNNYNLRIHCKIFCLQIFQMSFYLLRHNISNSSIFITNRKDKIILENRIFAYAKTKAQISCAVTAQLISAFVFAKQTYNSFPNNVQNFNILAFFCGYIGRFESDPVGNPEDQFSCVVAHFEFR